MSQMASAGIRLSHRSPWFWGLPAGSIILLLLIYATASNQSLFYLLNNWLYFKPESVWINITLFGDAAMVMVLMLPFVQKRPDIIVKGFVAALLASITLLSVKGYLQWPRPPAVLPPGSFHQIGNQFTQSSFPSGHSAAGFTLASIIIFMINDVRVRTLVLVYAMLIALSRVAIGVHWPMDIIAGALFGWTASWISVRFVPLDGKNLMAVRTITGFLLLAVIHLVFLHDRGDIQARFLEVLTPVICFILSLKGLKSLYIVPLLNHVKKK